MENYDKVLDQLAAVELISASDDDWYSDLVGATLWVRLMGDDWVLEQDYLGLGLVPWRCFRSSDVVVICRVSIH